MTSLTKLNIKATPSKTVGLYTYKLQRDLETLLNSYYRALQDADVAQHIYDELFRQAERIKELNLNFHDDLRGDHYNHIYRYMQSYGGPVTEETRNKFSYRFPIFADIADIRWYKAGVEKIKPYTDKHQQEVQDSSRFFDHIKELYGSKSVLFLVTDVPELGRFFTLEGEYKMNPHYVAKKSLRKKLDMNLLNTFMEVVAHHLL